MEAIAAQSALLERVRELEAEKAKLQAWNAEKSRYRLQQVNAGVFAYVLKDDSSAGEPSHMICANCFERGEKSLLQATHQIKAGRRIHICPHCKAEFMVGAIPRSGPIQAGTDFDPFTGR